MASPQLEHLETVVIGGGQAGLSVGHHLARRGMSFAILDANPRVGDPWRNRWDSLHVFTPARYCGLDGMPFPADPRSFPSKDAMADYMERYAESFDLPVRSGVRVERLSRRGEGFEIRTATGPSIEADNVVVAMSGWQEPSIPTAAAGLDPGTVQLHSSEYRNRGQLQPGNVLVVGAGNSGAEIALDVAPDHHTIVSGPDTGHVPFRIDGTLGRILVPFVLRVLFHRILTTGTPIGRKARPKMLVRGETLVRTKPKDLARAGIERVPRVVGAETGKPLLEDGRVVDAANVIWCTGFVPGFTWIDLPVLVDGQPRQDRGVVADQPGLYFVGQKFLYAVSSSQIHGVGRDADRVAGSVAAHMNDRAGSSPSSGAVGIPA